MSDKVDLIPYKSQEQTTVSIVTPSEKTKQLSLSKGILKYNNYKHVFYCKCIINIKTLINDKLL